MSTLFTPDVYQDPYPLYAELRGRGRAIREHEIMVGCWVVPHYDDIVALCKDSRVSADRTIAYTTFLDPKSEGARELGESFKRFMIFKDPPDHTRLRGLVNRAFLPRAVARMRSQIEAIVDELLDAADEELDLMAALAFPLPATVTADFMGMPREDWDRVREWTDPLARFFGDIHGLKRAVAANHELSGYVRELVARRRAEPGEDLLSTLIRADDELGALDDDELVSNAILLLLAGHHTTMNLIGNGMLALLRHPDQLQRLRDDPSLIRGAVDELLRYDSPVQAAGRIALQPLEIGDVSVKPGDRILILPGSGNRDPARFEVPDRLDVTRNASRHLSFAQGPHYCVGAPLALLEAEVAFTRLLARFPSITLLEEQPQYQINLTLRGLERLRIRAT